MAAGVEVRGRLATVYEALEDKDKTEGRGGSISLGYFTEENDAKMAARGKGPMGTDGQVHSYPAIVQDNGNAYILLSNQPVYVAGSYKEGVRARGLAKLDEEERRALGH